MFQAKFRQASRKIRETLEEQVQENFRIVFPEAFPKRSLQGRHFPVPTLGRSLTSI